MAPTDWSTPSPPTVPTPARVLAVVAHPDDESWLLGGALAAWADAGAEVRVLCMTAGEGGRDATGATAGPHALAALRREEFAEACAVLGVAGSIVGLPDGGLEASEVDGHAAIASLLERHHPDLVVTHGLDGDYGHRDHLAVARWVGALAQDALFAVLPPARMHPLWRGLRRAGFEGVELGLTPSSFGGAGDCSVSVDPARKRAAIACHASQLRGAPSDFLLPGLLGEPWAAEERYRRAPSKVTS